MPYTRPTLTDLRNGVAQDISASQPGSDPLLRFSNLNVMGVAQANLANLHFGYLDWIAKQSNPFSATGEFLEAWAALKKVYRKAATSAGAIVPGAVTFSAANGVLIPAGTGIVRGDGIAATTTADATAVAGTITVLAAFNSDPTGLTGAFGNTPVGVVMTLSQTIVGVQSSGLVSTAFAGGADLESDDDLRDRMLEAYQNTPQGGSEADYVQWATDLPGVTRAWCVRNGYGAGTVVVYVMLDVSESAHNGFPQGSNGVSSSDPRATAATGDQLIVANYIYLLQPVTALVFLMAPTPFSVNFSISGIPSANQAAVRTAIANVFLRNGSAKGGTTPINLIWSAIASVAGGNDFVMSSPTSDIANAVGTLPTLGTVTFS